MAKENGPRFMEDPNAAWSEKRRYQRPLTQEQLLAQAKKKRESFKHPEDGGENIESAQHHGDESANQEQRV